MAALLSFDYFLTDFLYRLVPHNQFLNQFFSFFSLRGNALLVWIIAILVSIAVEEIIHPGLQKRDIKFIIYFIVIFGFTAILVNYGLKNVTRRPRPIIKAGIFNEEVIPCPKDFSFPSGHAATAFAAAAVLAFFDKKHRYFYYSIAVFIAYSRIYLGCHYFFDVLCGALIGYLIAKIALPRLNHLKLASVHPHSAGKT